MKKYQYGYVELMEQEIKDFKIEITTDLGCPDIVTTKKEAFEAVKEIAQELYGAKAKVYRIVLEEVLK